MTKLLSEVVADARSLPADDQNRVAQALLVFMRELSHDRDGDV